jgi:hypothetical protein
LQWLGILNNKKSSLGKSIFINDTQILSSMCQWQGSRGRRRTMLMCKSHWMETQMLILHQLDIGTQTCLQMQWMLQPPQSGLQIRATFLCKEETIWTFLWSPYANRNIFMAGWLVLSIPSWVPLFNNFTFSWCCKSSSDATPSPKLGPRPWLKECGSMGTWGYAPSTQH